LDFVARLATYFGLTSDDLIGNRLGEKTGSGDSLYDQHMPVSQVNEPQAGYRTGNNPSRQHIPIYDLAESAPLSALFAEPGRFQPIDHLTASTLPRCDGGIRVGVEGMPPVYRAGDIVFYRRVNDMHNAIVWGEAYLLSFELDGDEYILIRYIHPSDCPDRVRLVEENPRHAPREIALDQIRALALIKGLVRVSLR
jgi:hypothetical protein